MTSLLMGKNLSQKKQYVEMVEEDGKNRNIKSRHTEYYVPYSAIFKV